MIDEFSREAVPTYKFWQDSDWAEFGHSRHLDATNVGLRCRVIALTLGIGLPNW